MIKYETNVFLANVAGQIGGQYLIGANEAWGQQAAYRFQQSLPIGGPLMWPAAPGGGIPYGISTDGHQLTWRPPGAPAPFQVLDANNNITGYTYSQAVIDATYAREKASIDAWYATQVPANFQEAWALNNYSTTSGATNFGFSGLTVTGDTISKGTEFELFANPITGLDISLNASKTSARRTNLAKSYTDWITKRWAEFQGPAGDMRLWGTEEDFAVDNNHTGETARGKYARETMAGYNLWNALLDSDVPELRPWRFNAVANYSFQSDGMLKGANVGGSLRWQDANVTGFPLMKNANQDALVFDVDHPYTGESETIIDFWVGYQRTLSERFKWRIQLNVRNAFSSDDLIPVTVQPDGSPAAYRIPEPRTWTITNTFSF